MVETRPFCRLGLYFHPHETFIAFGCIAGFDGCNRRDNIAIASDELYYGIIAFELDCDKLIYDPKTTVGPVEG